MQGLKEKIQAVAEKLLKEGQVDLVLGFAPGTLPLRNTPVFIRKAEDAGLLTWGYGCENNLANYLRAKRDKKVAVVAKGCDARAIVMLVAEKQLERANVYIIGVPCQGTIDRKKLEEVLAGRELETAEVKGDTVVLKGKDFEFTVPLKDLLHQSCLVCSYPTPPVYDELVGEPVNGREDNFADVQEFASRPAAERRAFWAEEMDKCIRCYACRNACPLCYCTECFVDCSTPQWVGKTFTPEESFFFQLGRATHLAGRCIDCGACERACPMGIKIRILTRKTVKDCKELFNYVAGINPDDKPALQTFSVDDPQPFLAKE